MKWIGNLIFFFVVVFTTANEIKMIKETNSEIEFEFYLPEYRSQLIEKDFRYFEYFETDEQNYYNINGSPFLPYFTAHFSIPAHDKMVVEIIDIDYEEQKVSTILPFNDEDSILFFNELYENEDLFPEQWVKLGTPYIFRDIRGINITINPFRYNPVQNIVQIANSMRIRLKSIGISHENPLRIQPLETTLPFEHLYKKHFSNYTNSQGTLKNIGEMLIISTEDLAESIEPFIRWKNQSGIKTTLILYPTYTGRNWIDIFTFMQRQYEMVGMAYILIIGDESLIPQPDTENDFKYSDFAYTLLAGNDNFPEVLIGRLPVKDKFQTEQTIHKLIEYEKNPLHLQPDLHSINISSYLFEQFKSNQNLSQHKIFSDLTESELVDVIYSGLYWFLYDNSLQISDSFIKSLASSKELPLVFAFSDEDNTFIGKEFLLSDSDTENTGTIAYMSIQNQSENEKNQNMQMILKALFSDNVYNLGTLAVESMLQLADENIFSTFSKNVLLFGDPSLSMNTITPQELFVNYTSILNSTPSSVSFSVRNQYGAVENAVISASLDGVLIKQVVTNKFGDATISFSDINDERLLIDITVSMRNHIPFLGSIHISSTQEEDNSFSLLKAELFPNPYYSEGMHRSRQSNLYYELTERSQVNISIYNSLGQLIKNVFQGEQAKGEYSFQWDGTDEFGRKVASGTYLYMIEVNHRTISKKMLLIK